MTAPRRMGRRRALWLAAAATTAVVVTGGLVAVLARMAGHFGGAGLIAWLISVASLLAVIAFTVALLVLIYTLYACARGPGRRAGESDR